MLKFTFIFTVFNLNQLRESFAPVYVILVLAALFTLMIDLVQLRVRVTRQTTVSFILVGLYLVCTLGALLQSLALISFFGAGLGLVRFLFAFPIFLASITYLRTIETLRAGLVGATVVVALLSLSLPYQIAFGQLAWLPSEYMRGGFSRYASLLGNVTAVGIAVGFYLVPALFAIRSTPLRLAVTAMLLLSSVASLSKAALVNVVLVPVCAVLLGLFKPLRVWSNWKLSDAAKLGLILAISIGAAFSIPAVRDRMLVNLASAGLAAVKQQDDVSIGQSVGERLLQHPIEVLTALDQIYGETGWLTGAGFGMSSTALVPEDDSLSIMAHNQYVEYMALGGVIFLMVFLMILTNIAISLVHAAVTAHRTGDTSAQNIFAVYLAVFVNYIINLPFANGLTYQPLQAAPFWMLVAITCLPVTHQSTVTGVKQRRVDGSPQR